MNKKGLIPFLTICILFALALVFVPATNTNKSTGKNLFDYLVHRDLDGEIKQATLIIGGDVMLGRTVMGKSVDEGDYLYPFRGIAATLSSADLTFVNLENPILENCERDLSGVSMVFCAKPEMLDGLVYGGVDVVTLANNHTLNYGKDGFLKTKLELGQKEIDYTGEDNLVIREVNNTKFGFLGFDKSQQVNPVLSEEEMALIIDSNNKVDILVIGMHWGVEYQDKALPGVRALARELVRLGADVVAGHHPHWVQDWETIEGKPVFYSLGNLVFDQMWSEKTKTGLLVKLTYEGGELVYEEFIKTYMSDWARPEVKKSS